MRSRGGAGEDSSRGVDVLPTSPSQAGSCLTSMCSCLILVRCAAGRRGGETGPRSEEESGSIGWGGLNDNQSIVKLQSNDKQIIIK